MNVFHIWKTRNQYHNCRILKVDVVKDELFFCQRYFGTEVVDLGPKYFQLYISYCIYFGHFQHLLLIMGK